MGDIRDFNEMKAKKEGAITPRSLLESALSYVSDKEQVVVISIDKDGYIKTGWSDGGGIKTIGLIEIAKQQIIEAMRE